MVGVLIACLDAFTQYVLLFRAVSKISAILSQN